MYPGVWTFVAVLLWPPWVARTSGLTRPPHTDQNLTDFVDTAVTNETSFLSYRLPDGSYRMEEGHLENGTWTVKGRFGWTAPDGTNHSWTFTADENGYWPKSQDLVAADPCLESPCGPYSLCSNKEGQALCSCLPGHLGPPPYCKPQCEMDAQCPRDKSCLDGKCTDTCPKKCGYDSECIVIDHIPLCFCLPDEYSYGLECKPPCEVNADCQSDRTCVDGVCVNQCLELCEEYEECSVEDHILRCIALCDDDDDCQDRKSCVYGECVDPCQKICGDNAECYADHNNTTCIRCEPDYCGTPPNCLRQCEENSECSSDRICFDGKCEDPCPDKCGNSSLCTVVNHIAICYCVPDNDFDDTYHCKPPCEDSVDCQLDRVCIDGKCLGCPQGVCGRNASCFVIDHSPNCSCLPDFIGTPPNCRPQCEIDIECPLDRTCAGGKCVDPCPEKCGDYAECNVVDHRPMCNKCLSRYIGTPPNCALACEESAQCPSDRACVDGKCVDPCPETCHGYECYVSEHRAACFSCLRNNGYGPPYCKVRCHENSECSSETACIGGHCKSPCSSRCGDNAECNVVDHTAICGNFLPGYTGIPPLSDPLGCGKIGQCPLDKTCVDGECVDSCQIICANYSYCLETTRGVSCSRCLPDDQEIPPSCDPRCQDNVECLGDKSCVDGECVDPCPYKCGQYAICTVNNHSPTCIGCERYSYGTPPNCQLGCGENADCRYDEACVDGSCQDPCPEKCGHYVFCAVDDHIPRCISCWPGFFGTPPKCRHGCEENEECPSDRTCLDGECVEPCQKTCGENADCYVVDHSPICVGCHPQYFGTPPNCRPGCEENAECPSDQTCLDGECVDPCPGLCRKYGDCYVVDHIQRCIARLPDDTGISTNFERRCESNSDCPEHRICLDSKCVDPCPGMCGDFAECYVVDHSPRCIRCLSGYFGTPPFCRSRCKKNDECPSFRTCVEGKCVDPCLEKCGVFAECYVVNHTPRCIRCLPDYFGTPPTCEPGCQGNGDCHYNKTCVDGQCKYPCPHFCRHFNCHVVNHSPLCSCPSSLLQDPFTGCNHPLVYPTYRPGSPKRPAHSINRIRTVNFPKISDHAAGGLASASSVKGRR